MQLHEDNRIIKSNHLLSLIILAISFVSCVSAGTPKLSGNSMDKVVEGKSSKAGVIGLLGEPEELLNLDKTTLDTYLARVLKTTVAEDMYPKGQYEVWNYSKWSYVAVDPVLVPSHEKSRVTLLIFNSDDVCIKKIYAEEGKFNF